MLDFESGIHGEAYKKVLMKDRSSKRKQPFSKPPSAVARKILIALETRHLRRRVPVTVPAHIGSFLRRFAPDTFVDHMMWKRQVRQYDQAE